MDVGVAGLHPKRPLIQYDLDDPPTASSSSVAVPPRSSFSTLPPPMKKRKQNHRNPQKHSHARFQKAPIQHWDDPGNAPVGMVYDEQEDGALPPAPVNLVAESVKVSTCTIVDNAEGEEGEYDEETVEGDGDVEEGEEESRALTHEEIWDDSALIDAWNSAEAEYEAYHGTSKAWKAESAKKSPLWYNKPYIAPRKPSARTHSTAPSLPQEQDTDEPDTAPLDFGTYVPTHDPSLAIQSDEAAASLTTATAPFFVPPPSTMMVSRDEAFQNALSAMYWSGYWTAVYHCQGQSSGTNSSVPAEAIEENAIEADEDEDDEDLVPAQR